MFENKQQFKEEYARRLVERYGVSVENSHISERYTVIFRLLFFQKKAGFSRTPPSRLY